MIAGIDAISYAEVAIVSLLKYCRDKISLTVITDSSEDKQSFAEMLARVGGNFACDVVSEADCDARAENMFRDFPNVRAFRKGHPCWRKITDPSLFAEPGEEIIVLDPDLYFPNAFHFEAAPEGSCC